MSWKLEWVYISLSDYLLQLCNGFILLLRRCRWNHWWCEWPRGLITGQPRVNRTATKSCIPVSEPGCTGNIAGVWRLLTPGAQCIVIKNRKPQGSGLSWFSHSIYSIELLWYQIWLWDSAVCICDASSRSRWLYLTITRQQWRWRRCGRSVGSWWVSIAGDTTCAELRSAGFRGVLWTESSTTHSATHCNISRSLMSAWQILGNFWWLWTSNQWKVCLWMTDSAVIVLVVL